MKQIRIDEWKSFDAQTWADSPRPGPSLLQSLPVEYFEALSPIDALALTYSPEAYLRPDQMPPSDPDWQSWLHIGGRGSGKSTAAASWVRAQILANKGGPPQHGMLVGFKSEEVMALQWSAIVDPQFWPPWVRYTLQEHKERVVFPDHNTVVHFHTSYQRELRGHNLRFAWCDELTKWPYPELLFNLQNSLRVDGPTPPRMVLTTNPPTQLDWICQHAMSRYTRVYRSRMRDNPTLSPAAIRRAYEEAGDTIEGARELDGEILLGAEGVLFGIEDLEQYRVEVPPAGLRTVVAVDPAQSGKRNADEVGIVAVGECGGHYYVLRSAIGKMDPETWSQRVLDDADATGARHLVVEPTGSGDYPRHTLQAAMQLRGGQRYPIVEARAKGKKEQRAGPLSTMARRGRLHIVGRQPILEEQLCTWYPGSRAGSPGGLDALVHGVTWLSGGYQRVQGDEHAGEAQAQRQLTGALRVRARSRSLV